MPINKIDAILNLDNTSVNEGVIYGAVAKITQKRKNDLTSFDLVVEYSNDITEILGIVYNKKTTYPFKTFKIPVILDLDNKSPNDVYVNKTIESQGLDFLNPKTYGKINSKITDLLSKQKELELQVNLLTQQKNDADNKTKTKIDKTILKLNKKIDQIKKAIANLQKKMDNEKNKKVKEIKSKMGVNTLLGVNDVNIEEAVNKKIAYVVGDKLKTLEGVVIPSDKQGFDTSQNMSEFIPNPGPIQDLNTVIYKNQKKSTVYSDFTYDRLLREFLRVDTDIRILREIYDFYKNYQGEKYFTDKNITLASYSHIYIKNGKQLGSQFSLIYLNKYLETPIVNFVANENEADVKLLGENNNPIFLKFNYNIKNIDVLIKIASYIQSIDYIFYQYFNNTGIGILIKELVAEAINSKFKFKNIVINRQNDNLRILKPYEVIILYTLYSYNLIPDSESIKLLQDICLNPENYSTPELVRSKMNEDSYSSIKNLLESLANALENKTITLSNGNKVVFEDIYSYNTKVYDVILTPQFRGDTFVSDYITQFKSNVAIEPTPLDIMTFIKENKQQIINYYTKLDELNNKFNNIQQLLDSTDISEDKKSAAKEELKIVNNNISAVEKELENTFSNLFQAYSRYLILNKKEKFSLKITVDGSGVKQSYEELGVVDTNNATCEFIYNGQWFYNQGSMYDQHNFQNIFNFHIFFTKTKVQGQVKKYLSFSNIPLKSILPDFTSNNEYFYISPGFHIKYTKFTTNSFINFTFVYITPYSYVRAFYLKFNLPYQFYFNLTTKTEDLNKKPYIAQYYNNINANKALVYIITDKVDKIGSLYYSPNTEEIVLDKKMLKKMKMNSFSKINPKSGKIIYRHESEGKENIQGLILIY